MIFYTRQFAQADSALRQGKHISRNDYTTYEFLTQNYGELERFYASYPARLVQHPDGFFFLLPKGDLIPSKFLPKSVMHLGQFIALKCRDPEITKSDGRISLAALINDLETSVPADTLSKVYAHRQKEVLTGGRIHEEVRRALRTLDELQFIRLDSETLTPLEAIHRFAEVARHGGALDETSALALLLQRGVVTEQDEGDEEEIDDVRQD
jgi:chromosome condensin MukBEF MukE localization factor